MAKTDILIGSHTALPPLSRAVFAVASVVLAWETRRQTRRHLRMLQDHLLQDIGLPRETVVTECNKPFWKG
jgi:uncharacterized protein YjiS (DUF1127 family)